MLIEFSVGNYRSFKEVVTFSMVAAPIAVRDSAIDESNLFAATKEIKLLKSAAIYGAIPFIGDLDRVLGRIMARC